MGKSRVNVPLIEFLKNRIYLGAYDYTPQDTSDLVYFTVEDALAYNAFHLDFGPLHIGNLYRFAVVLHNILNEEANQGKAIVLYSTTSPKERANTACLLCCYMTLVQSWSPHQVLQPIAQIDPPFQGFRDAGYSNADFEITIQDVVYGMWRAKERGMIDLTTFNLEEYEQYERVDQGDFNVISKDFIAFASPQQSSRKPTLNEPFKKVLNYFMENEVQLVVRLNSHLYDSAEFTKRNIQHIDMIFDDGTCPTMEFVKQFIGASECVINKGGKIAVHCKAGLGRTGCLIGAHLIYTHGFTANECIGYMRMIRPGMVVGPQQHWLYLHQNDFRDWRHTMVLDNRPDAFIGGLFPLTPYDEFKARMKQEAKQRKLQHQQVNSSVSHMDSSFQTPIRRRKISGVLASKIQTAVPNESPGQPRKYQEANTSGVEEIVNNSDEEQGETMQDIQSPARKDTSSDWRVLKSISANGSNQPVQLTKTTTTTTTRTVSTTLSSSPQSSPTHSIKLPKSRSGSRVNSGMIQSKSPGNRIQSAGIRKVSGKKF
ncbi:protein tyrosine phosphatase CDC14 [Suhomyces tanzawaensis NRRL Y-17324]|uniref:Tyrosine-protein phosphatase CDC14 n=1 Tax=Suhomyces tanzawaensis NRRL Y-17324 TaxID=984487 RepID=A0A1E4SQY9_9ASCO|nr:protein tyrosine phosphatase CDC14 [Suhomyces tanzawaensis NRRL Y-17324]ODV81822.1 protein tyrosine phosphatase CDC14 [Suhomyces tanzawaensis NRRL Y-17324]